MFSRDTALQIGFSLVFAALSVRLLQVMLFDHQRYNVLAQQQHMVEETLLGQRGEVYTADGYPLVINREVYLLFAVPVEIENPDESRLNLVDLIYDLVAQGPAPDELLSPSKQDSDGNLEEEGQGDGSDLQAFRLPADLYTLRRIYFGSQVGNQALDRDKVFRERLDYLLSEGLSQQDNQFVQLLRHLNNDEKQKFERLELPGLHFQSEEKRTYPENQMAAHVLGFVGKDESGQDKGYFGLEGYYDRDLSGREGYELRERDVIGQRIPFGISQVREPSHGRDLVLTIQRELQYMLEKKLAEGVQRYRAQDGSAILLDPASGAIWAMATYPGYAPEYWTHYLRGETDVSKIDVYQNWAISANYEPGSVMKPLTIGAALNEKIIAPETVYQDTGPVTYSGYAVKTWNNKYHGAITMIQVLELSNNTGAAWVGHHLGFDKYAQYVERFRLGEPTRVDLEGDEAGIVRPKTEWRDIDLANMAFGQGISVTPLQLATVFAALVNGGELYEPYVVAHLVDHRTDQPLVIDRQPKLVAQVIEPEVSEQLRYMLRKVVTDGEFRWFVQQAGMNNFDIGGKTGTAQIPFAGRYDPNKTNTSFVGFAPVADPEFVLLVRLNQPTSSTYSAETAVPLWMEMAKELMVYFEIPPGR